MSTFFDFLLLVLGFGLVIFVHEFGHFAVAKAVGIRVEQFAIGMGPALLAWRKGIGLRVGTTQPDYDAKLKAGVPAAQLGETEYRVNYLPIGGYVKMLGQEDLDMAAVVADPRSYSSRPIWARMCVVSAGVVMNLIFAMVLFVICFMWGVNATRPIIGGVHPDSLAAVTMPTNAADRNVTVPGILPGDRVIAINGKAIQTWEQVIMAAAMAKPSEVLHVAVRRRGSDLVFDLEPRPNQETRLLDLGVQPTRSSTVIDFAAGSETARYVQSAFVRAGLGEIAISPKMKLAQVNGERIDALWQLSRAIDESDGTPLQLTFEDAESGMTQQATLRTDPDFMLAQVQRDSSWYAVANVLGLVPAPAIALTESTKDEADGIKVGDLIEQVGAERWPLGDEVQRALTPRSTVPVTVRRGDRSLNFDVVVKRNGAAGFSLDEMPAMSPPIVAGTLATIPVSYSGEVEQTMIASPAASLNLMPGTRILSLNGAPVANWREVFVALRRSLKSDTFESSVAITYELPIPGRPTESALWTIDQRSAQTLLALQWHSQLGIDVFKPLFEIQKASGPIEAVQMGLDRTWEMIISTYQTLDRLVRGSIKVNQLKGPVGIAQIGTAVAGQGLPYLLLFLGIININLAVLNFLPIPIVDGGLMVFLIIEKLKGSPVSVQVQNAATVVGLLLIGSLFLVTFYNDVLNLVNSLMS